MTNWTPGLAALAMTAAAGAMAGGIDRSGQDIGILFEPGSSIRLEFGSVTPSLSGRDTLGNPIANVGADFTQVQLGYKADLSPRLSYAFILDAPFGAEVAYGGNPAATMLGGTQVSAQSTAMTGLLKLKLGERASLYGGLRAQRASAEITLRGLAYAGLSGYSVDLSEDASLGYVLGAAYEIPDIALRVALTWNSAITHDFATVERLGAATVGVAPTKVKTPQSINLDVQSGVAKDTLVFGGIRWVNWSKFRLDPAFIVANTGSGLIALEDTTTWTLGVGHRFTPEWSGLFSLTYEAAGKPLVSPLAPTTGQFGATLGAVYTKGNMKTTFGVNYTRLGDAQPATAGAARASFTDNEALGLGVRVEYRF
ncbi:OmpP1/FadL family transporter [Stagnihabitans tardus]|uniref:Transporter n=1 Tax=Stagnihabitans tardus TaxID=2699202 RepID=A0AAE4Y9V9_9RHOB|nr:outer membrane protein transport protein [Stagnihabitans tardus]NBZ87999.1 transporter [Stagnihabitans tardus]